MAGKRYCFCGRVVLWQFLFSAKDKFHLVPTLLAGGAAGLATCFVEIPPDVMKSRLQTGKAVLASYPYALLKSVVFQLQMVLTLRECAASSENYCEKGTFYRFTAGSVRLRCILFLEVR